MAHWQTGRSIWRSFGLRRLARLPARHGAVNTGAQPDKKMQHQAHSELGGAGADALRLIALDSQDLSAMSCNLQDAVVRAADLAFLPKERRFALLASRFDWVAAEHGRMERCRAGLHFDHVAKVATTGFDRRDPGVVLNLLSIAFEPEEAPAGSVVLTFSGGAAIRLAVECVDAQMRDLGPRWTARHRPGHAIDDAPAGG